MAKRTSLEMQNSVLVSWSLSYVLIMLIPLVFSGIVYFTTVDIIRTDITKSNSAALRQIQQSLDGRLREIEDLSLRINSNPKVWALMELFSRNRDLPHTFSTVKTVLDMNSELSTYALANGFIERFSIVFNEGDFVWSAYSIFSKKTFYSQSVASRESSYEDWLRSLDQKHVSRFVRTPDGGISFLQSLPIGSPTAKAVLRVDLNVGKIREQMADAGWYSDIATLIVDQSDQVLLSSPAGAEKALPRIGYSELSGDFSLRELRAGNRKFAVSHISSKQTSWKYACAIPSSVFSEKVEYVKVLTLFGLLLCALIEIGVAAYFLRRNYNPLRHVTAYLSTLTGSLNKKGKNEFRYIEDSINRVFEEKEVVSRELQRQTAALRGNIAVKLLKGRYAARPPDPDSLEAYGIRFRSDFFLVALFYSVGSGENAAFKSSGNDEERLKAVQAVIARESVSVLGERFEILITEADEIIAAILNFKTPPAPDWRARCDRDIEALMELLSERHGLSCAAALGGAHETFQGISRSYTEALDVMEYQLFEWNDRVLFFDDVKEAEKKNLNYSYSAETEQRLLNSIGVGDVRQGAAIIDEVFHENFSAGIAGVQLAKCLMVDLMSTFLKAMNGRGILEGAQMLEDRMPIHELYACKTLEEIKLTLIEYLTIVCRYTQEYNAKHGEGKVVKKIVSLVESRYPDINLNIACLADSMRMNPKYIAYLYKESTGESIVVLIHRTRIAAAKELLRKDHSIADTAVQVGYGNSNAFIRIFKKYEGITPGQFKEMS